MGYEDPEKAIDLHREQKNKYRTELAQQREKNKKPSQETPPLIGSKKSESTELPEDPFNVLLHIINGAVIQKMGINANSPSEAIKLAILQLPPGERKYVLEKESRAKNCRTGKVYPDC